MLGALLSFNQYKTDVESRYLMTSRSNVVISWCNCLTNNDNNEVTHKYEVYNRGINLTESLVDTFHAKLL